MSDNQLRKIAEGLENLLGSLSANHSVVYNDEKDRADVYWSSGAGGSIIKIEVRQNGRVSIILTGIGAIKAVSEDGRKTTHSIKDWDETSRVYHYVKEWVERIAKPISYTDNKISYYLNGRN